MKNFLVDVFSFPGIIEAWRSGKRIEAVSLAAVDALPYALVVIGLLGSSGTANLRISAEDIRLVQADLVTLCAFSLLLPIAFVKLISNRLLREPK